MPRSETFPKRNTPRKTALLLPSISGRLTCYGSVCIFGLGIRCSDRLEKKGKYSCSIEIIMQSLQIIIAKATTGAI